MALEVSAGCEMERGIGIAQAGMRPVRAVIAKRHEIPPARSLPAAATPRDPWGRIMRSDPKRFVKRLVTLFYGPEKSVNQDCGARLDQTDARWA
jgi:hypothetical protein